MARAFVFPGQGSQHVGMGSALAEAFPDARLVFEEVNDALDLHLSRLMFNGPEDELTLTENTQPALAAMSLAVVRVIENQGGLTLAGNADFVAGHSVGEYAALAAAGALSLADTVRLVRHRGEAMQRAVPVGEGAMAALLGLDIEAAEAVAEAAAEGDVCAAANDNAPGQVVISGDRAAVERAIVIAPDHGARRCVELPVSAPFHCSLMAPAADAMSEALGGVTIATPSIAVIANVTAAPVAVPADIRRLLVEQVTGRVRWRESVLYMRDHGVDTLVELGAGKVLGGLARRIDRDLSAISVAAPEDIEALLKTF